MAIVATICAWGVNDLNAGARSGKPSTVGAFPAAAGQWIGVGPEPFAFQANPSNIQSGRVAAIAVDPRDTSHWLIGAGNGGVWESRDAGGSFAPIAMMLLRFL
jgi:hypothetical protein